jgi:ribonuclease HII
MRILAGVDEAGLGPILGPLVVGGAALAGPEGADPWAALQPLVARERKEKGKVRVADSKKVHQGPHGLRALEETALAFWAARHGGLPATLGGWLQQLGVDLAALARCPWYEDLSQPLVHVADDGFVQLHGERLARSLREHGIALLELVARPVDVEEWNALIAATDNKSKAHFHAYGAVLARLLDAVPAGVDGHVVADRCGGRMHYGADLRRLRPGAHVAVVREEPAISTYQLRRDDGAVSTVTFAERGEDRAFPTALASCVAKYLRERMVGCLNAWFQARVPGLQPTAGYYVDGHRFLADLLPHMQALAVPSERLVRVR